ncbi:MAG: hypothetical protein U9R65_09280 [Pseudomonadota bacterium]|nr:hypothetical protein [Pseudomonadota bacterium]
MKYDPLVRLFSTDLSDETVDRLFAFLNLLTNAFFQAYEEQIVRIAQQEAHDDLCSPVNIDDGDFDDEIPM